MKLQQFLVLLVLSLAGFTDVVGEHHMVRVYMAPDVDVGTLVKMGISLEGSRIKKGVFVDVVVSDGDLIRLDKAGLRYEVLVKNLTEYYSKRANRALAKRIGLGSMGGYYTFSEVVEQLDSMKAHFPDLISEKQSIGNSVEGREVWVVKISDNPDEDEPDEPEVLFTALHHAREPESMMVLIYYMWYLLENYSTSEEVKYLVDNRELWFIPVVNPDGYVYNQEVAPDGGGMQRKNRRPNECTEIYEIGVDLNRNYDYMWGYDDKGSSPEPCEQAFRGDSAFSEPEVQAIKNFCLDHDIKIALNYHTYSNLLIYPFGYREGALPPEPDLSIFREFLNDMARWNGYKVGTAMETVGYLVNGEACDWMYGELGIFAATPEVGSFFDGFWPPTERIIPLAEENLRPNLYISWVAGSFIKLDSIKFVGDNEYFIPGDTTCFLLRVKNKGLGDSRGSVDLKVISDFPFISIAGDELSLGSIGRRQVIELSDPIRVSLSGDAPQGEKFRLVFLLKEADGYTFTDTFAFYVGEPDTIFFDGFEETLANWDVDGNWGKSAESYEGKYSITDSPLEDYSPGVSVLETKNFIDLRNYSRVFLGYATKYSIEDDWDFAMVQVSSDGINWTSVRAPNMKPGTGYGEQPEGEYGYDGDLNEWIVESVNLDDYIDADSVKIRFLLSADSYVNKDGWYIDNVCLWGYKHEPFMAGDVNYDGKVDISDAVIVVDIILNVLRPNGEQFIAADVDGNGVINTQDIMELVKIILEESDF